MAAYGNIDKFKLGQVDAVSSNTIITYIAATQIAAGVAVFKKKPLSAQTDGTIGSYLLEDIVFSIGGFLGITVTDISTISSNAFGQDTYEINDSVPVIIKGSVWCYVDGFQSAFIQAQDFAYVTPRGHFTNVSTPPNPEEPRLLVGRFLTDWDPSLGKRGVKVQIGKVLT